MSERWMDRIPECPCHRMTMRYARPVMMSDGVVLHVYECRFGNAYTDYGPAPEQEEEQAGARRTCCPEPS